MVMHAIRIHTYGSPEVMQLEELPMPVPGSEQVLVRVLAASVNFLDIQQRRGDLVLQAFYNREAAGFVDKLPLTLGQQGIGVVEVLGLASKR
jgi:NADPH2:quinone reductase